MEYFTMQYLKMAVFKTWEIPGLRFRAEKKLWRCRLHHGCTVIDQRQITSREYGTQV